MKLFDWINNNTNKEMKPNQEQNELITSIIMLNNQLEDFLDSKVFNDKFTVLKYKSNRVITNRNKFSYSAETITLLKKPFFNNWEWDDIELLNLLELIFVELKLVDDFNLDLIILRNFLMSVKNNHYDNVYIFKLAFS